MYIYLPSVLSPLALNMYYKQTRTANNAGKCQQGAIKWPKQEPKQKVQKSRKSPRWQKWCTRSLEEPRTLSKKELKDLILNMALSEELLGSPKR